MTSTYFKKYVLPALLSLIVIVFFFPLAFTTISINGISADISLLISHSAGITGSLFIILAIAIFWQFKDDSLFQFNSFLIALLLMGGISATAAQLNEHGIKPFFAFQRPYSEQLDQQGVLNANWFYSHPDKGERQSLLTKKLAEPSAYLAGISPEVLKHWQKEAGYSFPSGHSQNAFFLAALMAFILYSKSKRWYLVMLPFLWAIAVCITRVTLGVHSPTDVAIGALLGSFYAWLLIRLQIIKKLTQLYENTIWNSQRRNGARHP